MQQTIRKPSFREVVAVTTMNLDDLGFIFNAQRVGPMNFNALRNADYGRSFRMSTFPKLIPLVHASLENEGYEMAVVCTPTSNVFSTAYDVFKRPRIID